MPTPSPTAGPTPGARHKHSRESPCTPLRNARWHPADRLGRSAIDQENLDYEYDRRLLPLGMMPGGCKRDPVAPTGPQSSDLARTVVRGEREFASAWSRQITLWHCTAAHQAPNSETRPIARPLTPDCGRALSGGRLSQLSDTQLVTNANQSWHNTLATRIALDDQWQIQMPARLYIHNKHIRATIRRLYVASLVNRSDREAIPAPF